MEYINGHWERVETVEDVLRLITENMGYDFGKKAEEVIESRIESRIEKLLWERCKHCGG